MLLEIDFNLISKTHKNIRKDSARVIVWHDITNEEYIAIYLLLCNFF